MLLLRTEGDGVRSVGKIVLRLLCLFEEDRIEVAMFVCEDRIEVGVFVVSLKSENKQEYVEYRNKAGASTCEQKK